MMSMELGKRWVEALRSGKYVQGRGGLRDNKNNTYCCLGVLCDLIENAEQRWFIYEPDQHGSESAYMKFGDPKDAESNGSYAPSYVWPLDGLSGQAYLAGMNDAGASFETIADKITDTILPLLQPEGA